MASNNFHVASSWTTTKSKIKAFFQNKWKEEWQRLSKGLITKAFFKTPKDAAILKTVHLTHGLTQILTGHNRLYCFLHRLSMVASPLCECQEEAETIEHFLFACNRYVVQREAFFATLELKSSKRRPSLHQLMTTKVNINAFKTYIETTKRLDLSHQT